MTSGRTPAEACGNSCVRDTFLATRGEREVGRELDLSGIMRCPRGISAIRFTRLVLTPLFGTIFLKVFPDQKDCTVMGKRIVLPCLDVTMIAFSREIYSEVLFLPETARVLTECPLPRPPPVHPIILLKSN